jgi:hypothetical protein
MTTFVMNKSTASIFCYQNKYRHRAAILSFENADGEVLEVPPEITVARIITDVERVQEHQEVTTT